MSERKHQGRQMRLEMRTTASPREVWDAWTDPARFEAPLTAALTRLAGALATGGTP